VQGEVEFIIHSAANIRIEAHMRSCLLANYRVGSSAMSCTMMHIKHTYVSGPCSSRIPPPIAHHSHLFLQGTSNVLRLAEGCRKLKALVHLSSAFANMHQPEGPTIGEQIYPLHVNGSACDPCDLAEVRETCRPAAMSSAISNVACCLPESRLPGAITACTHSRDSRLVHMPCCRSC